MRATPICGYLYDMSELCIIVIYKYIYYYDSLNAFIIEFLVV